MTRAILLTAVVFAAPAHANIASSTNVNATVVDHYSEIVVSEPYTARQCTNVEVPVYGTVQRQGNAAEGALLGMLLGGVIGKGLTGDNDGAAAGAVMGGIIGADKGSQPKTQEVVTGYRTERKCTDVTRYRDTIEEIYSHSVVTWTQNGVEYQVEFNRMD